MTDELTALIDDIAATHTEPEPGELPACWPTLVELGLPLVGVDESRGGSGGSFADLVVLTRALGRHAVSTPLVETAVVSWVVAHAGPVGPAVRTIALDTRGGTPWGRHASEVLTYAGGAATVGKPEVVRERLNIAGEPADLVDPGTGTPVASAPSQEQVRTRLAVLRAAAVTGAVAGAYELTRTYVSTRVQFGQPLIRIPAVAANLAKIKTSLVQCEAALARTSEDDFAAAAVARVIASRAATETARIAHQLHGAMGITAEYPLHRYTKRLWAWRDADVPAHEWAQLLGEQVVARGEEAMWTDLTA